MSALIDTTPVLLPIPKLAKDRTALVRDILEITGGKSVRTYIRDNVYYFYVPKYVVYCLGEKR